MMSCLEHTRQWRKERMIQNFLRDILVTYPEDEVKLQIELGGGTEASKEWKILKTPFS